MNAPIRSEILVGSTRVTASLSPLHAMLSSIEREDNASRINPMWNHPSIRRTIRGWPLSEDDVDYSNLARDVGNAFLIGDHGAAVFTHLVSTIYDVHIGVLPDGRGDWCRLFTRACLHWMFTRTNAMEIVGRCPRIYPATRKLAIDVGGKLEAINPGGWTGPNGGVACEQYTVRILDWIREAPGLVERGRWFYEKFARECARLGLKFTGNVPDDRCRHAGALVECIFGGTAGKGLGIYERYRALAGGPFIQAMNDNPVTVNFGGVVLFFREEDFWAHSLMKKDG